LACPWPGASPRRCARRSHCSSEGWSPPALFPGAGSTAPALPGVTDTGPCEPRRSGAATRANGVSPHDAARRSTAEKYLAATETVHAEKRAVSSKAVTRMDLREDSRGTRDQRCRTAAARLPRKWLVLITRRSGNGGNEAHGEAATAKQPRRSRATVKTFPMVRSRRVLDQGETKASVSEPRWLCRLGAHDNACARGALQHVAGGHGQERADYVRYS